MWSMLFAYKQYRSKIPQVYLMAMNTDYGFPTKKVEIWKPSV